MSAAPTLREALAELVALQDRSPGAIWPGVWERGRAALSAQAPPKTCARCRNGTVKCTPALCGNLDEGAQAQPAPGRRALSEQECDDADAILRAIGLDPETYRTDGGFLNMPKIKAAIAHQNDYQRAAQGTPQAIWTHESERPIEYVQDTLDQATFDDPAQAAPRAIQIGDTVTTPGGKVGLVCEPITVRGEGWHGSYFVSELKRAEKP